MYTVKCTMYKCSVSNLECIVYNVQCTLYNVQCTVQNFSSRHQWAKGWPYCTLITLGIARMIWSSGPGGGLGCTMIKGDARPHTVWRQFHVLQPKFGGWFATKHWHHDRLLRTLKKYYNHWCLITLYCGYWATPLKQEGWAMYLKYTEVKTRFPTTH